MKYNFIKLKQEGFKFFFITPALVLFVLVVVHPFIKGIGYSFTDWDGISETYNYIGLKNYIRIFSDQSLIIPIKNTLLYTAITVVANNIMGLILALGLSKGGKAVSIFRTMFFMPFVISLVLAAFIWTYIYSDVFYGLFGIKSLLGNPKTVMWGISLISLWRDSGYVMIIYLAGIQSIPEEFYEAAKVDGANAIKRLFKITIPMLVPALTVNVTLFLGWGLKVFDYVMAATKGGPGRASETLAMFVYKYTFPYNRAGYGQAAAIVMMLGIFVITSVVATQFRKREVEI